MKKLRDSREENRGETEKEKDEERRWSITQQARYGVYFRCVSLTN
jgi:hypothetical protein